MNSTISMECDVNLEVDKELPSGIDDVPCEESRKALRKMAVIFNEKSIEDDARYAHFQNFFADINERFHEQKRYSSKDSHIIKKTPFDARKMGTEELFENNKKFSKNFLNYHIVESNLKAYHVIPTKRVLPGNLMPLVVLNFVQFYVKDKIYKLRRLLEADSKNNRYPASLWIVNWFILMSACLLLNIWSNLQLKTWAF